MNTKGKVYLIIDSKIHIPDFLKLSKTHPTFRAQLKEFMVIKNPAYEEALRYRRFASGISKIIPLWKYDLNNDVMTLPNGFLPELIQLLQSHQINFRIRDRRTTLDEIKTDCKIAFRDYQTPAIEAMVQAGGGVLVAPAGSGKTVMGMEIIARLGQPALWLVHTKELAEQAAKTAVNILGLNYLDIGMVGAGQDRIGDFLTTGIIQTLSKRDLSNIADRFGTVVVDETHHGPAPTWQDVVNQLPAKYRYGVTATPERADGLEIITERVIGPIIHIVTREAVRASGGTITPQLKVIKTNYQPEVYKLSYQKRVRWAGAAGTDKTTTSYSKLITQVLNDEKRNALITDTIVKNAVGHYSLVLSERVGHCKQLYRLLHKAAPYLRIEILHGGTDKSRRARIMGMMNEGELDILFGVDIAKEGLDIPRLDRLHLVGGGRNENEVEQKVGRIQRPFPGKEDAILFDYVDEKIPSLVRQHKARRQVYKNLGII